MESTATADGTLVADWVDAPMRSLAADSMSSFSATTGGRAASLALVLMAESLTVKSLSADMSEVRPVLEADPEAVGVLLAVVAADLSPALDIGEPGAVSDVTSVRSIIVEEERRLSRDDPWKEKRHVRNGVCSDYGNRGTFYF